MRSWRGPTKKDELRELPKIPTKTTNALSFGSPVTDWETVVGAVFKRLRRWFLSRFSSSMLVRRALMEHVESSEKRLGDLRKKSLKTSKAGSLKYRLWRIFGDRKGSGSRVFTRGFFWRKPA